MRCVRVRSIPRLQASGSRLEERAAVERERRGPRSGAGALAALCACVGVAACGGLDTPDLSTGEIAGGLGASAPGGYVYVLGRTALRAEVASDGAFVLGGVPAGPATLVAFDGAGGDGLLACTVLGGRRVTVGTAAEGSAAPAAQPPGSASPAAGLGSILPAAGRVVVTVRLPVGASPDPAAPPIVTVVGTELVAVPAAPAADLGPLPPGTFRVRAEAAGLAAGEVDVTVEAGAITAVEIGVGATTP